MKVIIKYVKRNKMTKEAFKRAVLTIGYKSINEFCEDNYLSEGNIYRQKMVGAKPLKIFNLLKEIYDLKGENKRLRDLIIELNIEKRG